MVDCEKIKNMQSKLDNFFKKVSGPKRKKYFVYDSEKAYYTDEILDPDSFVYLETKCKGISSVDLYYKKVESDIYITQKNVFNNQNKEYVPLLKSNLQKAIRRGMKEIALKTTLTLLMIDKTSLFRRLPIIMIEDVTLFDSMDILVWFMMSSSTLYKFTVKDVNLLLTIVENLCDCMTFYDYKDTDNINGIDIDYKEIEKDYPHCLSLYYRKLYGGMDGDIQLIKKAIYDYSKNKKEIKNIDIRNIRNIRNIDIRDIRDIIIPEAIDFHCYPIILTKLSEKNGISKEKVKEFIWFSESAINIRKNDTIEKSKEYIYNNLKKDLDLFRDSIFMFS